MKSIYVDKLYKEKNESALTSSKGNQNKWFSAGFWYKEDGLGYEALSEIIVSRLLEKTNVCGFASYEYAQIVRGEKISRGCCSADFMSPQDDKLISVERLFKNIYGESAAEAILRYSDISDRIRFVSERVEKATGLGNFGKYLKNILTVDALFLNEDRHFHNLSVIQKMDGTFRVCPIFDNGAALFSDVMGDYPLNLNPEQCYEKIEAKPFCSDFDEQLDACEILYPEEPVCMNFTIKDVESILAEFKDVYPANIRSRVLKTMRWQIRKYAYLFK